MKKPHATNMKCCKIIRKPIPVLEEWGWNDEEQWKFVWEWHGEFESVSGKEDNE